MSLGNDNKVGHSAPKAALVILLWRALGVPLDMAKAAGGKCVSWCGVTYHLDPIPKVSIDERRRVALVDDLRGILANNKVSRHSLQLSSPPLTRVCWAHV